MIPVYAFLEGDTIALLLLATSSDTCDSLVRKLLQMAKARVRPEGEYILLLNGKKQSGEASIKDMELSPLDRIDVRKKRGAT